MHNYHTENYYFHTNGDPVPGDVLIRKVSAEWDTAIFRTTSEEIITFCAAARLKALGPTLVLRTTMFQIDGPDVTLRTLTPQEPEDAFNIVVSMTDLQWFATQALQRRFELYVEDAFDGRDASQIMSAIGLFSDLTRKN